MAGETVPEKERRFFAVHLQILWLSEEMSQTLLNIHAIIFTVRRFREFLGLSDDGYVPRRGRGVRHNERNQRGACRSKLA